MLSHKVVIIYTGRSHKNKAQHLEWSDMELNQVSEQVQFSAEEISLEVLICGPRAIEIIKLLEV
jgi:hypothetical protein